MGKDFRFTSSRKARVKISMLSCVGFERDSECDVSDRDLVIIYISPLAHPQLESIQR